MVWFKMKVEMLDKNLDMLTKKFKTERIPLIQVFQVVGKRSEQDGYGELRRDVEENGFIKPIIIINNTIENYNLAIRKVNKSFVRFWQEHKPYLCIYGNQRIDIALKLKIFHLDAILTPNIEWAYAVYLKINE